MIRSPFSYYGGKSRIAHLYPPPSHDLIIEPFAGAGTYAFLYHDREVWLNDLDPITYSIWDFLINGDKSWLDAVPAVVVPGEKVSQLLPDNAPAGLIALCRAEANQGTQGARGVHDQITRVGAKCWNARFRRKLDVVIPRVAHWSITQLDYHALPNLKATWFVDPPYMNVAGGRYRHGAGEIDYAELACWCQERAGAVICCENLGATWLPFEPLTERRGIRSRYQTSRAMEVLWTSANSAGDFGWHMLDGEDTEK